MAPFFRGPFSEWPTALGSSRILEHGRIVLCHKFGCLEQDSVSCALKMSPFGNLTKEQLRDVCTPTDGQSVEELLTAIAKLGQDGIEAAARQIGRFVVVDQWRGFLNHVRPLVMKSKLFSPKRKAEIAATHPYRQIDVLVVIRCLYFNLINHTRCPAGVFRKKVLGIQADQNHRKLSVNEMVARTKEAFGISANRSMFQVLDSEELQWVWNAQPVVLNNTLAKMGLLLYLTGVLGWHCSHLLDQRPYPERGHSCPSGIGLASPLNWAIQIAQVNFDQGVRMPVDVVFGLLPDHRTMQVPAFLNIFKAPLLLMGYGDLDEKVRVFVCMIERLQEWLGVDDQGIQVLTFIDAANILLYVMGKLYATLPADECELDGSKSSPEPGRVVFARAMMAYIGREL